ncbi:MAG: hypothetical protein ACOX6T_07845 [Myxococcales bacterium]|jgi:hypothetical protein
MQIKCENCGAAIDPANVHQELAVARCTRCHGLVDLARRRGEFGSSPRSRERVPLPERFTVDEGPGRLKVSWRWFSLAHLFLLVFCLLWNGVLLLWYLAISIGFSATAEAVPASTALVFVGFPIGHVVVGVWLTYCTLAGFLNRTSVEVSGGALRIRHAPLPWPGKRIEAHVISQLFCEEKLHRGKHGSQSTYRLHAIVGRERRRVLLLKLDDMQQALYLEQRLELELGIVDRPVPGELKVA